MIFNQYLQGRSKIEIDTQDIIQNILDEYTSGIQVTQVQTQKLTHQIKLLMPLEMFKRKMIWKDQKMKLKLMQMMLYQEQEVKQQNIAS